MTDNRRCKSRHRKCWVMFGGRLLWCWECGAIREMTFYEQMSGSGSIAHRFSKPKGKRWIYPVGPNGENPAMKRVKDLTS